MPETTRKPEASSGGRTALLIMAKMFDLQAKDETSNLNRRGQEKVAARLREEALKMPTARR